MVGDEKKGDGSVEKEMDGKGGTWGLCSLMSSILLAFGVHRTKIDAVVYVCNLQNQMIVYAIYCASRVTRLTKRITRQSKEHPIQAI